MEYVEHLSKDPVMAAMIKKHGAFTLKKQKDICTYLCYSIMSQQLSTKVADVFHARFDKLYDGKPTAEKIMATSIETFRGMGLSQAKANYVINVATFAKTQGMEVKQLQAMDDMEIIKYLTQIKGVGRWTVEMLLMFALGRKDVFATDDLGIQQAMIGAYGLRPRDKKKFRLRMEKIAEQWRPYRTYACMHLWRWKDNG